MKISIAFIIIFTINYCNNVVNTANTLNLAGNIQIQNSKFRCGQILCPNDTFQCSVKYRSYLGNLRIAIISNCSNNKGKSLLHLITNYTNPNPGVVVRKFSAANLAGNTVSCNTCSTLEEARRAAKNTVAENMALMRLEMGTDDVSTTSLSNEIKKEMGEEGQNSSSTSLGGFSSNNGTSYNATNAYGVGSTNTTAYVLSGSNFASNYSSSVSGSHEKSNPTSMKIGNTNVTNTPELGSANENVTATPPAVSTNGNTTTPGAVSTNGNTTTPGAASTNGNTTTATNIGNTSAITATNIIGNTSASNATTPNIGNTVTTPTIGSTNATTVENDSNVKAVTTPTSMGSTNTTLTNIGSINTTAT